MENKEKFARLLTKILAYVFFAAMLLIILFPVYWIIASSMKGKEEIYAIPPTFLPQHPSFDNFITAITESDCLRSLGNSVFVSTAAMILTIVVCVCAAYSITRLEFKGKKIYFGLIASTQVFPMVVTIVPLYLLFRRVSLYNTHASLILTYTAICTPIAFTLLLGYFRDLPKELEEAALIDGCGRLKCLLHILLPIAKPGIVATGIYIFLNCWQEYLVAVSLIGDRKLYTLTLCLTTFQTEHSVNWGALMAVSVVIAAPAVVLFFFIEKYFVDSLAGAVKG